LEAKDHHDALEMIYELVEHKSQPTLSQHLIRSLHQIELSAIFHHKLVHIHPFIDGKERKKR
jgi:Fic family protein